MEEQEEDEAATMWLQKAADGDSEDEEGEEVREQDDEEGEDGEWG